MVFGAWHPWMRLSVSAAAVLGVNWSSSHVFCDALDSNETDPASITNLSSYKFVVCGGGTAAQAATRKLLKADPNASILVVAEEMRFPFRNSPLWRWYRGNPPLEESKESLNQIGIDLKGKGQQWVADRLVGLDVAQKEVILKSGKRVGYESCLLALGGGAKKPSWADNDLVMDARTHAGQLRLIRRAERNLDHVTVLGGGWIACYIACILSAMGKTKVTMVFPESAPLGRYLPKYLTDYVVAHLRAHKVELLSYRTVRWVQPRGEEAEVYCSKVYDGLDVTGVLTDAVVLAPTFVPGTTEENASVLSDERLLVDPGSKGLIFTPELLVASNVYVAGDLLTAGGNANQSHISAEESGRTAAANMLGESQIFRAERCYQTEIPAANVAIDCIGKVSSQNETFGYFFSKARKRTDLQGPGIVFYIAPKSCVIIGILMWNANSVDRDKVRALLHRDMGSRVTMERSLRSMAAELFGLDTEQQIIGYSRMGRPGKRGTSLSDNEELWTVAALPTMSPDRVQKERFIETMKENGDRILNRKPETGRSKAGSS